MEKYKLRGTYFGKQGDEEEEISLRQAQKKFARKVHFQIISVWQKYIQKVTAPSIPRLHSLNL